MKISKYGYSQEPHISKISDQSFYHCPTVKKVPRHEVDEKPGGD